MPRLSTTSSISKTKKRQQSEPGLFIHYDPSNPRSYPNSGTVIYSLADTTFYSSFDKIIYNSVRSYFQLNSTYWKVNAGYNSKDYTNGMSVTFWYWVFYKTYTNSAIISSQPFSVSGKYDIGTKLFTLTIKVKINGQNKVDTKTVIYSVPLEKASWLHIGIGYLNNMIYLYINGQLVITASNEANSNPGTISTNDTEIVFGSVVTGILNKTREFKEGRYGAIRFYTRLLDLSDIIRIYTIEKTTFIGPKDVVPIRSTNLVFNTSGNLLTNTVSSSSGAVYGTVTYSTLQGGYTSFSDHPTDSTMSTFTNLIRYDSSALSSISGELTISAWINLPVLTYCCIAENYFFKRNVRRSGFQFLTTPTGMNFLYAESLSSGNQVGASISFILNKWYNLSATINSSRLKLYVDGELIAEERISGTVLTSTDPLNIGRSKNNTILYDTTFTPRSGPGKAISIAKVSIYNTVLSDNDIWSNHRADRPTYE